jgi:hypothetical protein
MKTGLGSLLILLTPVWLVSCSSSRVLQTSGSAAPTGLIAEVKVELKPEGMKQEDQEAYRANSMSGAIRAALLDELRRQKKLADDGATIDISVTDFHLRTGTEVFWIGVMAGSDYLAATVTVKRGDAVLKTFEASAKGSESAWSGLVLGRVSSNSRADLFCRMISKRVMSQL